MVGGRPITGNLDFWFRSLMVADGRGKMNGAALNGWKDLPMELLLRIVSRGDDCTFIVVSGVCTGWRHALCTGLTHLSLSWCKENMNNLVLSLAPKFTKLQSISLRQNKPQLEDNAIEAIANQCHDLRDLDLSKSHGLSDRSLYALAHGCPCLTKLNISGCSAFSDSALAYLTGFCRNLKNLNLCGCVKPASDRALEAIAYNCSQLQTLNLGWCESITDRGVISLALGCPDLRALDLCGCVLITALVSLLQRSLSLIHLMGTREHGDFFIVERRLLRVQFAGDGWTTILGHQDKGLQCQRSSAGAPNLVPQSSMRPPPSLGTEQGRGQRRPRAKGPVLVTKLPMLGSPPQCLWLGSAPQLQQALIHLEEVLSSPI